MSEAPKRVWLDRWPDAPDVRSVVSYVFQEDQSQEGDVAYVRADIADGCRAALEAINEADDWDAMKAIAAGALAKGDGK